MTRLNVYAGPAGFYLIRGGPAGDEAVLDSRTGTTAVLPGPAPKEGDKFPPNKTYYEIPIAIQDRSFNADGSLFYPDTRAFFDGITGPYIPDTDVSPIWNPEFFGNMIIVNGNTWPFQTVEQRRYRLRFLNGCQSRFLILDFGDIPGVEVWQIGNEGGFLAAPVNLTADHGNRLLMGLAERADLIVDFTNVPLGNTCSRNVGPDEPFGGGEPGVDFDPADPDTPARSAVPRRARGRRRPDHAAAVPVAAGHHAAPGGDDPAAGPARADVGEGFDDAATRSMGTDRGDPRHRSRRAMDERMWMDPVTENPAVGATEVWEFYNATADAHPMHVHEVAFQVVDRQAIIVDEDGEVVLADPARRRPDPARALGERASRTPSSPTPARSPAAGAVRHARPVRLALPHRRARGQRDDAALPHRPAAARPTRLNMKQSPPAAAEFGARRCPRQESNLEPSD